MTAACLEGFGISTLDGQDYENEALSIGGTYHGVTNLEMTAAYNAIANGGCYQEPHFYTKIVDHNGDILLENPENGKQVIQESTAALLTLAMEDVMENGTGQTANPSSLRVAGKSGTTNDRRDVWFVGFSRDYTCGVWGGFDDNSEQEDNGYVKRLWKAVMEGTSSQSGSRKELADTSGLTSEKICTKCGKLAVSGLCDHTLQGDMTVKEWFVPGTEPTERCTCHVRLSICGDSGKLANTWCPLSSRDTGVYLTSGTAGTADEAYSAEGIDKETTCDVHTHMQDFFSGIFHSDGEENQTEDSGSEEHDSGGSWWSSLWGGGDSGSSGSGESSYGSGDSGSYGSSGWNEDSGSHGSGSWNGDSGSHGSSSWSEDSYENGSDSGHGSGGWFDDWFSGWGGWSDSWSPW